MNTTIQKLAAVFGVVFILVGIVGFITPGGMGMQPTDPATAPKMFGIPVNLVENVLHVLFGLWGLAASRGWAGSKSYFTISGTLYAVLALAGFVSPNGFGLLPLGGNALVLHAVLAVVMLAIGLTAKDGDSRPTATV